MKRYTSSLILVLLLSGCGGGGSSAVSRDGSGTEEATAEAVVQQENTETAGYILTGRVLDETFTTATVCLDENGNKECDPTEPSVITGGEGMYAFSVTGSATAPLLAVLEEETTDETSRAFATRRYQMQRPGGGGVISPLTTLVQDRVEGGLTAEAAEAAVREGLGFGAEVNLNDDYLALGQQGSGPHRQLQALAGQMAVLLQQDFASGASMEEAVASVAQQVAPPESQEEETTAADTSTSGRSYSVADTNQAICYDPSGGAIPCGSAYDGQDAQYQGNTPDYTVNGDGTVTDNVTGILWSATADLNGDGTVDADDKRTQSEAVSYCSDLVLGGHAYWRLPTIKQLYSLIDFSGKDVSGYNGTDTSSLTPFIDDAVFGFGYGDTSAGERIIDAQWATTSIYTSTTMNGAETMFGVNLADGRIKGYPTANKTYYVYCLRYNSTYGNNDFSGNGDGTVTDAATGLMWEQDDSGEPMAWADALERCESAETGGYGDWRLPDIKELQSLVDYTRSPDATGSAAIDPLFNATSFTNEAGRTDWGFYWSSTTHANMTDGGSAAYVAFGRALGYMNGQWMDVHGAGAQRSDPKTMPTGQGLNQYGTVTDANGDTALYHGPQGDVVRVANYARCVRNAGEETAETVETEEEEERLSAVERVLYAPMNDTSTYLVDAEGNTLHTWASAYRPGLAAYMLEGGSLLRSGTVNDTRFTAGGAGGVVEKIAWNGGVEWSFTLDDPDMLLHHDLEPLPNGNVLMIAWEALTEAEALAAGRNPSLIENGEVWSDVILEVDPETSEIVWQWRVRNHLVQEYDADKAGYGDVSANRGKIDFNYVGAGPDTKTDWTHINGVSYDPTRDRIVLSVKNFSEGWVIDHAIPTEEAAGSAGDLLYRFGNPEAYGGSGERQLYGQHDIQWVDDGTLLLFNNGSPRDRAWSSVDRYALPLGSDGTLGENEATLAWRYTADDLYAVSISGVALLENGNVLVTEGTDGRIFEIDEEGNILWEHTVAGSVFKAEHYTNE